MNFRYAALAVMLVLLVGDCQSSAAERPNVLLICVDDLKPTLGCYGDSNAITPHIDALAASGLRLDSAYCNQAVCSPSRNSLMTGLRPQTIGVYDLGTHFRLAAPDVVTVSENFKRHGYHAAGLGKIYHTGHGNKDDARSWSEPSWRSKARQYLDPKNVAAIKPDNKGKRRGPATESAVVDDAAYGDGQTANEAIARLDAFKKQPDQPFFLAVGFVKPHLPFVAPKRYWDLYDPSKLPMPKVTKAPEGAPDYAKTSGGELRNYSDIDNGKIDRATTRHLIHGYYAATSYIDAQIGRVLEELDRLQLSDNTVVVLWGDHGWHLGDHGMWCKHTNYEQAARIPLLIRAPGGVANQSSAAMVETVDLYPTLCQLAGLPFPMEVDGQSFADVVLGKSDQARPYVTHVYPRGGRLGRAIRDPRYRMVQWKLQGQPNDTADIELYDYQTDPLETKNLASSEPEVVAAMLALLDTHPKPKRQWKPKQN
ncbi:sulfatase [Stieleria sp. TO1_6]|uniref:sulfatase n=1 Tax=Stieleria tagensis TaxID=2956795 RepID=UPI00209B10E1|nr:sulfatase [Stieleria tagensis]MCO8122180.1 sulfatase [Stieleria tagensis]